MIDEAMEGKIDMIVTKSISRFALEFKSGTSVDIHR